MQTRILQQIIPSILTSDGAGVKLRRSIGKKAGLYFDPFLMLDEFSSDNADDYIAGFPNHPHRGFETITYMLDGAMLHEDHLGNRGHLKAGGAQWMTAGRGIIHSEMPQQEKGRLRGFQLWVNLSTKEKMKTASYRDIAPEEIPQVNLENGGLVKVIAGCLNGINGPIQGLSTKLIFFDVRLGKDEYFKMPISDSHSAFVYPYEGQVIIEQKALEPHVVGLLSDGDCVEIFAAEDKPTAFLLLAARPLKQPIVQYGPFVMNTKAEIEQAISDYKNGTLV